MDVSIFKDVWASNIDKKNLTWEQIITECENPQRYPNKQVMPLIKLAAFGDVRSEKGSLRHDSNVLYVTGMEADYDGEVIQPEVAAQIMRSMGIKGVIYTSPSHTPEKPRWRVLVPFMAPQLPDARYAFMGRLNWAFGGELAGESFTKSQSFYFGAIDGAEYKALSIDGAYLDTMQGLGETYPVKKRQVERTYEDDGRKPDIAELRSALMAIPANDYSTWIAMGQALCSLGEEGFALWDEWSKTADNYGGTERWHTFSGERTGWQAVFAKAYGLGWGKTDMATVGFGNGVDISLGPVPLTTKLNPASFPDLGGAKHNKPLATAQNLNHLLTCYGVICNYDELLKDKYITIPGKSNEINDMRNTADEAEIRSLLGRNELPVDPFINQLPIQFEQSVSNPIRAWITGKPWDGISRVAQLCETVIVTPDDIEYRNQVIKVWLTQCIAAMDGGMRSPIKNRIHKYESVLVFQGAQGKKKTSWLLSLVPREYQEYVKDGLTLDVSNKDSIKNVVSCWLGELGELDGTFKKSDIARIKGFLSNRVDILRLPYDRTPNTYQRRTSYFASVNKADFLVDTTGNRRFLVLAVQGTNPDHGIDMQQLWAEIYQGYVMGDKWWPDDELDVLIQQAHIKHEEMDPILDALETHFDLSVQPETSQIFTLTRILEKIGRYGIRGWEMSTLKRLLEERGFKYLRGSVKGYRLKEKADGAKYFGTDDPTDSV